MTSASSMQPEWNIKKREVWCPLCKMYGMSDKPAPICECGNQMITVVYNHERQRITGNDKLALRINESA
jgi:hypothetical protein